MSRVAIFLMAFLLTTMAAAQEGSPNHSGEIYALGSVASGGSGEPKGFDGFRAGGAWQPSPRFSLVADLSRFLATDSNANFTSFMAGPRFYSADHHGLSGFFEFFYGAERASVAGQPAIGIGCSREEPVSTFISLAQLFGALLNWMSYWVTTPSQALLP
jgi:hypothetical protein